MNLSPEQTAAQLRCPHDEAGAAFGQMMNLRNLTQILGSFEAVQLQNGDRILETGCGNGGLLGYILSQAENLHYTGLEISPLMHAQAQAFNAPFLEAGLANYRLYDGGALPFTDESFDKIVSVNTVYFWDDAPSALSELSRVLKSGGRLCLNFCEKDFMAKLPFAAHGFVLWDAAEIEQQVGALPLQRVARVQEEDLAVSKDGRLVKRPYVHLVMERA